MPSPRRAYGTGGIWHDAARDRYVGTLELGWNERGNRRRKTVVAKTRSGVQAKLRDALREAKEADAPVVGGKPTVKVWADQWLDITQRKIRPTSWQANRSQVANWIVPTIGHRRLEQLRPADVRAVERAMETAGKSTATVARCMAVLQKMLKDAIVEGHPIPQGVLLVDTTSAGESDRDAIPTPDAVALLAAAAELGDGSRWVAALLQGMRPAECLGLTWDCIDFQADEMDISWQLKSLPYVEPRRPASGFRVPRGYVARQAFKSLHLVRPKTASGQRIIPVVPWMRNALVTWREVCPRTPLGLVWPSPPSRQSGGIARPRRDADDRAAWVALQDRAQVARLDGTVGRRYALYEARHTTATLLRELGRDDATITAVLGHASILSTKAYLHTDRTKTRDAMEGMAGLLQLGSFRSARADSRQ